MAITLPIILLSAGLLARKEDPRGVLSFGPNEGASVRKVAACTWNMSQTDCRGTMTAGTRKQDISAALPRTDASRTTHLQVVDKYSKLCGDQIAVLGRSFEIARRDISITIRTADSSSKESNGHVTSPIEGHDVRFERKGVGDKYSCAEEGKATIRKEMLGGLHAQLDFGEALPRSDKEQREWTIEARWLGELLSPGGELFPSSEGTKRPPGGAKSASINFGAAWLNVLGPDLFEKAEGHISSRIQNIQERNSSPGTIPILLDVDVVTSADVSAEMRQLLEADIPEGKPFDYTHTAVCKFKGNGVMKWSSVDRCFVSTQLQLDVTTSEELTLKIESRDLDGKPTPTVIEMSGEWKGHVDVSIEEVERH